MRAHVVLTCLSLVCAGAVNAEQPDVREHPFKALREEATMQAPEESPMDYRLAGTIETNTGFEALIERADGRVVRGRVGDPVMDRHVIANVWAEGAELNTPQGTIQLNLRPQGEATP